MNKRNSMSFKMLEKMTMGISLINNLNNYCIGKPKKMEATSQYPHHSLNKCYRL